MNILDQKEYRTYRCPFCRQYAQVGPARCNACGREVTADDANRLADFETLIAQAWSQARRSMFTATAGLVPMVLSLRIYRAARFTAVEQPAEAAELFRALSWLCRPVAAVFFLAAILFWAIWWFRFHQLSRHPELRVARRDCWIAISTAAPGLVTSVYLLIRDL